MLLGDILPLDRYVTAAYLCAMANAQLARSPAAPKGNEVDYTDPKYWNGLIKMSLSKFFILCVLNRQRMHGYDITKAVEDTTQGCCSPTPGALYPVLKEFEAGGYVTVEHEVVGGRQRKVYAITDRGREAFRVAVQAWSEVGACITAGGKDACCG
jgi:PadR family transcriptional regulator, regulatory protein PadR